MSTFFQQAMVSAAKAVIKRRKKVRPVSAVQLDREINRMRAEISFFLRNYTFLALGILSATLGIKGFLLPNQFLFGGVTGISLMLDAVTGPSFVVYLVLLHLPFLVLGYWNFGANFALKSLGALVVLALCIYFLNIPAVSEDRLLVAVFGGFFLGLGIGLVIRGGAMIDGTEMLAIFVSKRSSISIGGVVLFFNLLIFGAGAILLSLETAFYAVLSYMAAARTIDFVIDGIEEYIGVTIISRYSEEIRLTIIEKLGRGCTVYLGKRGFAARGETLVSTDIIFTVITRLELARLQKEINKIDEEAFVVMGAVKDTRGGMVKKRPLIN